MNGGKVILYIRKSLYDGKCPNDEGFYVFTKREMIDESLVSTYEFDRYKTDIFDYFSNKCYLGVYGCYPEYAQESLYVDVSYSRGKFQFRKNPILEQDDLKHLWALPPISMEYFSYDFFDKKHRRRHNWPLEPIYDSIPNDWDADLLEELRQSRKWSDVQALMQSNEQLIEQAKIIDCEFTVATLIVGYENCKASLALYKAVRASLPELCGFLLCHGAEPNKIIQNGYNSLDALSGASKENACWETIAKLLIDFKGDLTTGNFNISSFAGTIFAHGSDELCIYFLDALNRQGLLNYVSVTKMSPLKLLKMYKANDSKVIQHYDKIKEMQ